MGKFLKILAAILGLLVVLVIAAVIIIPLVVDPNDFKDQITAEVKKATGRELLMSGDLGLSVFPWLGLELNGLRLSNAPGFGDQPFAAVRHAQVRVKLMPLLSKALEVDTLRVEGLQLNLAKAKDGRTNWQDLAGAGKPEAPTPEEKPPAAGPGLTGLAIGGVEVADARLVWDDQSSGQRYEVADFALNTGAISPGRPVDLKLAFAVDSAQPLLKARVNLDGRLETDQALQKLSLVPLTVKIEDLQTDAVRGRLELAAGVDADLAAQHYRLMDLRLGLAVAGEGLPKGGVEAELMADVMADLAAETLSLSGMTLTSGELAVSGALRGEKIQSAPSFQGNLSVAEFSLRSWMQTLGLAVPLTADPEVLTRVALDVNLKSSPKQVALEKLAMTLDDTRLDGVVRLQPPDKPGVRFDLTVDAIDLDRYLPPPAEGEAAEAKKTPSAKGESAELFPVETLRQLDVAGVFRLGRLVVKKLVAQDIQLSVKAKDGRIKLEEQVKAFCQGAIGGSIGIDVTGAEPRLSVAQRMKGIQAGPLLADLTGKDTLTGQGGFNASITARGQTPDALTRTLGGKLDFKLTDGALKGFNLAKTIREAKARFKGRPAAAGDEPEQTDFSELQGSANIAKGVLVNRDLLAKSPLLRIEGAGKVNLPAQSLDYTLTPVIVGTLKGQGGKELEDLKGIPVPVRCTGPLAKPDYSINWKEVVVATQKEKIKKKSAKYEEKLDRKIDKKLEGKVPDSLRDSLKDTLKGLF